MTNRKAEWTQTYPKKKWTQGDKTHSNKPELPSQVPLYNAEEIYSALEVIRKIMKTDAAQPFNAPVDPIALGIPDYFEVIDKPMDFGTICKNLENGVKYKNSKDVLNDVQYIWVNCSKYYKKGHYLLELMKRMRNKFNEYWTDAGLFIEQPQEMDDRAILDRMEKTLRGSTNVQWGSVGTYQCKDKMNRSRPQPHQAQNPPMQRPYQGNRSSSTHQTPHPHADENRRCSGGLGDVHLGFLNNVDTEPGRCHRTDGKKWRCSRDVCPDQKYCERHINRGRRRSKEDVPFPPHMGSMMRCRNHEPSSSNFQPHQLPEALLTRVQLRSSQPQPSHIQGCSEVEEEHLCSPSRACSSIRCSKRAPKLREGQMNATDQHNDMLSSSQIVSPRPLTSLGQPHQPPGGTLQVQLSPSQHQPPHPQDVIDKEEEYSRSTPAVGLLNTTDNHRDQVLSSQIMNLQPSSNNGAPLQHPEWICQFHFRLPSRPQEGRVDTRRVKEKAPHRTRELNPLRKYKKKLHHKVSPLEVTNSQLCVQTPQQQEASQSLAVESNEFTQIMGQDSPPVLDVPSHTEAEALNMVSTANTEMKEMKEKLASTEQTCAQMATQMATMMSIISDMQKKLSNKDYVQHVPSQGEDVSNDSGGLPSASVQGVLPNQGPRIIKSG